MRSEIGLLLLCGTALMFGGCDRRSGDAGQGAANAVSANLASAPTSGEATAGEVPPSAADTTGKDADAKIDRSHRGDLAPDTPLDAPGGGTITLDTLRGKPMLVNLWATWCAPCIAELPALDKLAAAHPGMRIVTVAQDMSDQKAIDAFFAKHGLAHLPHYRDPESQLSFHYATGLLPTSIFYDADGKEVARIGGALDWAGKDAQDLFDAAAE